MVRDGATVELLATEIVPGDVIAVGPGDQLIADGEAIACRGMTIDESMLTGEADGIQKDLGDRLLSGSFCISGSGHYVVDAVREDSYAGRLAGEARAFRHPPSPLQEEVNSVILACTYVMIPLAILLVITLKVRSVSLDEAAQTATAGLVTLIPEGLVLLMSVTFAVAAVRLAKRDTLIQQMSASESLAAVDTICVDKTGHADRRRAAPGHRRVCRGSRLGGRCRRPRALRGQRRRPQPDPRDDRRAPPRRGGRGQRRGPLLLGVEVEWADPLRGATYMLGAPDILAESGALQLPPDWPARSSRRPPRGGASSPSARPPRRCPSSPATARRRRGWNRWRWSCSRRRCGPTPPRRSRSCASRKST